MGVVDNDVVVLGRKVMGLHQLLKEDRETDQAEGRKDVKTSEPSQQP